MSSFSFHFLISFDLTCQESSTVHSIIGSSHFILPATTTRGSFAASIILEGFVTLYYDQNEVLYVQVGSILGKFNASPDLTKRPFCFCPIWPPGALSAKCWSGGFSTLYSEQNEILYGLVG